MGGGITHEDLNEIQENFLESKCLRSLVNLPFKVFNFCIDAFLYGVGKGNLTTDKRIKHKIGTIQTTKGTLTVPIMKMTCFDLTCGFITDMAEIKEGMTKYSDFMGIRPIFPTNIELKTIETYWILNFRRPKDVTGKNDIYFYVLSEMEDLIYIEKIIDNNLIDYEKMLNNYEEELERLELIENEIVNVTQPTEVCFNENCTSTKRKDL